MKERLRSSQSSSNHNQEPLEHSHYESPHKQRHEEGSALGEETQYKLEKVFEEAGNREERYINLIKEQEERMGKQAERYLQSLREIKKEFLGFMSAATGERQVWRPLQALEHFSNKTPQRLNSLQFTTKTLQQYQQQESKVEPQLRCKIHCYYYTPFAQDCLRYQLPERVTLRVRGLQGGGVVGRGARVIGEEDAADNLNCLLNRVPFQLAAEDDQPVVFEFTIPCTAQAIAHYRRKEAQVELLDERGLFLTAYGKLSLTSLLHYEERPMEWQLKPLSLFSPIDGSKVAELSVKLGNSLQVRERQEHYRVQSSTPMEVGTLKAQVDYNDDESRMIQRISKFKNATHSLLLGIGATREARPERIFQAEGDRTVLMHRQKKELESILEYKNSHKSELMEKLFNEAIDRYFLNQCIIASPNYITFNYRSQDRSHRKLLVKVELAARGQEGGQGQGGQESAAALAVLQQMEARVMSPRQVAVLVREEAVEVEPGQADYEFDEQEQSLWAISGQTHAITVRVLCLPLKQALLPALAAHYELKVTLLDEYSQVVESFHSKLKLRLPAPEHSLHLHGYCESHSQLEIPFEEEAVLRKTVLTNAAGLELQWSPTFNRLSLRVPHQFPGERTYYLTVNDHHNLYSIATYELVLTSYPKLAKTISLRLGEVTKLVLDFTFNEEQLTGMLKEGQGKGKKGISALRVAVFSSKPEHCTVNLEGEPQMVCQLNKTYQIEAKVQTFDPLPNPEKILVHAVDLDGSRILKRWLLSIQKEQTQSFKQVLRLSCEHGKPLKYKFQLMNEDANQKTFRFYSSNLALLAVPQPLTLIANQRTAVQLQFHVRLAITPEEALQPLRIILTVTDGSAFNNYLFELNVRLK